MQISLPQPAGGRLIAGTAHTRHYLRGRVAPTCGRRRLVFLLLLAAAATATAAEPARMRVSTPPAGPASLRLSGPTATQSVGPVTVTVAGLPAFDPAKPFDTQSTWLENLRFQVSAPDGAPTEIAQELTLSVRPLEWRLSCKINADTPGVYVLLCAWLEEPFGLAMHRVEVGHVTPPVVPPVTPPPTDPIQPPLPTKATAAVYIYEKDQHQPPRAVQAAINKINTDGSGVVASIFEQDATTGLGSVPAQYKAALPSARAVGLPSLVVLAGDIVLRVVRGPTTEAQVLEAVK